MSNDDDKKDDFPSVGFAAISMDDLKEGNLPDNVPPMVREALKSILPQLGLRSVEGKGLIRSIDPSKVVTLSDMFLNIWNAQPCYNNPADMLAACLLRAKLMRMDGEKQDAPAELFEEAEKIAEEIFQQVTKNPDPEDPSVH